MTKYLRIACIIVLFLGNNVLFAQHYIVFEKYKGLNKTKLGPDLYLSQNNVTLEDKDTTVSIFNLYYTIDTLKTYGLQLNLLRESQQDISKLANDILITIIPLVKPGENLRYEKLSKKELDSLSIQTNEQLLYKAIPALYVNLTSTNFTKPLLRTLEYNLIIKDGKDYFKVEQPVYVEYHLIYIDGWYFPNQFKDAVLNIATLWSNKIYNMADLEKIAPLQNQYVKDQLTNRTYLSKIDESYSAKPIFYFWKFSPPHSGGINIQQRLIYRDFGGLINFQFLEKVGIVNCTLEFFYKERFPPNCCMNEFPSFKITSINSLDPLSFQKIYQNYVKPKGITILEGEIFGY